MFQKHIYIKLSYLNITQIQITVYKLLLFEWATHALDSYAFNTNILLHENLSK